MIDEQLTPEERMLVQQIQSVSKPKLDQAARNAIRERMVNEYRTVTTAGKTQSTPSRPGVSFQRAVQLGAAAIVLIAVGLTLAQFRNQPPTSDVETSTLTISSASQVAVVPSHTIESAAERTSVTPAITPAASLTPELLPSPTLRPAPTSEPTPSNTPLQPTPEVVLIIEGPVANITENSVSIYDFRVEVEAQHPILQVLDVGDVVRVQGVLVGDGIVVANSIGNITSTTGATDATVRLDGPVEAINDSTIVVNGIPIQLSSDDALLQTLQIGDFVSVEGNFENTGTAIVLVVVNIAVIDNGIVTGDPACWYHDSGMGMGHWHCDGMGMGVGMGNDGMGIGSDGMGMGSGGMGMGG